MRDGNVCVSEVKREARKDAIARSQVRLRLGRYADSPTRNPSDFAHGPVDDRGWDRSEVPAVARLGAAIQWKGVKVLEFVQQFTS